MHIVHVLIRLLETVNIFRTLGVVVVVAEIQNLSGFSCFIHKFKLGHCMCCIENCFIRTSYFEYN